MSIEVVEFEASLYVLREDEGGWHSDLPTESRPLLRIGDRIGSSTLYAEPIFVRQFLSRGETHDVTILAFPHFAPYVRSSIDFSLLWGTQEIARGKVVRVRND